MRSSSFEDQNGGKIRPAAFNPRGPSFLLLLLAGAGAGGYWGVSKVTRPQEKSSRNQPQAGAAEPETSLPRRGTPRPDVEPPKGSAKIHFLNVASQSTAPSFLTTPPQAGGGITPWFNGNRPAPHFDPGAPFAPGRALFTRPVPNTGPLFWSAVPVPGNAPAFTTGAGGLVTQAEVTALFNGIETALTQVEANLVQQVFGDSLPLVGTAFSAASAAGLSPLHHITGLKDRIKAGLNTLTGAATYTPAQAQSALQSALSSAGITISGLSVDAGNATDLKINFATSKSFPAFMADLDAGLGMPGLGLQTSGQASTVLTYTLNFTIGVDGQGFYVNTANEACSLGFTTTVPGLDVSARLSKLRFRLTDESATDGDSVPSTSFGGTFGLNLLDPSGADNRLRANELGGDLLDASLTANAAINLNLASDLGSARFPAISADLNFAWTFNNAPVIPADLNTTFGGVPQVAFKNVKLDFGALLTNFVRPVLGDIRTYSEPVYPVVKGVQEPIPVLAQLKELNPSLPASLLEIAVAQGAVTREQADRFDIFAKILDISNNLPVSQAQGVILDLGDFNLGTADPRIPNFNIAGITPNKIRTAAEAVLQHPAIQATMQKFGEFPVSIPGGGTGKGLELPIVKQPETAFNLLLGKDVDLITMDTDTVRFQTPPFDKFLRIAGPLGVRLFGTAKVRVDMDFGYDTRGLVQFAQTGDIAKFLNGLHVKVPVDAGGNPISMVELTADFRASAAANAVVAEVGAGGKIFANVHASLVDPDGNRRAHLDEFISLFNQSPLCPFQAEGALTAGLRAYIRLGEPPFAWTEDYDFISGTVFDFNFACGDDPLPVLARITGGDARLHVGPESMLRMVGNLDDTGEEFRITRTGGTLGAENIAITFRVDGTSSTRIGALPYGPVGGVIRGDGGLDADTITLAPDVQSPANLSGGAGHDELAGGAGDDTLSGGEGRDRLFGAGGADTLRGGTEDDVLEGGPGPDVIDGGDGHDAVSFSRSTQNVQIDLAAGTGTNDAAGDTFLSIEQVMGTPFNDTLRGSSAPDVLFGLAGNDLIEGRAGDDLLEGGPGADTLNGGPGNDATSYFQSPAGVNVNLLSLVSTGGDAQGDVLTDIEALEGSKFDDILTGNDSVNLINGGEGRDTISGGGGDDELHGGFDVMDERPGFDDVIDGGPGNDRIFGEGNSDSVNGGDGDDFIDMRAVAPPTGEPPPPEGDTINGGPGNDTIYGSPSDDIINGGDGDDFVDGFGGMDWAIPPPPPLLVPYPKWESRNGVYRLYGMGGDQMDGGLGNDTVSFEHASAQSHYDVAGNYVNYGVSVNLSTGAVGNAAWESTVTGFENIVGTDYQDNLTGTDGPNIFWPLRGGGESAPFTGGPDYIDGLGGVDTLVIDFSLHDDPALTGVSGPAATQFGRNGAPGVPGDGYIATNIEQYHLTGASKNDSLIAPANGYDDILIGNGGNDFLGGRGGSDILRGGEGNDSITANGAYNFDRYGVIDGHDVIDGGPGDDVIDDVAFQFGTGQPMLAAGTLLQIDGGPGFDKISANFSNQTIPVIWTSAAPTNWEFADGAYARNFEVIDTILTGSGNDSLTQLGRVDNGLWTGPGDDVINPGIGSDTVVGGPGDDLCIVDWSVGDDGTLSGINANDGYRRYQAAAPFSQVDFLRMYDIERVHLTGTSKADTLYSGALGGTLLGRGGDDALNGADGDDRIEGADGNDTIRGNAGNDQIEGGEGDDKIYTRHSTTVAGNATINAGPGNDLVYSEFTGQPGAGYGNDTINMGEGDDDMVALWFDGSFGRTYAIAGNVQRFDGGAGNDSGSADFGNQSLGLSFIEGTDNNIEFPDGSYYRHFERLRYMTTGSGNDRIILTSRSQQDVSLREGNDFVNMGLGLDLVFGGAGEDTLVADWSMGDDANISGISFDGNYLRRTDTSTNAVVDSLRAPEFEHFCFTGGSKNDAMVATDGSDVLKGMRGNDQIRTYGGDDVLIGCDPVNGRGAGEVDQLTGDAGADIFVLGDETGRFYDDGNPATQGLNDYAKITDFNPAQDKLKLFGPPSSYLIGPSPVSGVAGSALFYDSNGNGTLDPTDELIATLGTATITAANTLAQTEPVTPPTIESAGLTGITVSFTGTAPALTFTMNQTLRPGVALELLASADMGNQDPWKVVASKAGDSIWSGPAATILTTPAGGKVSATITIPPQPGERARFYKFQVRNL